MPITHDYVEPSNDVVDASVFGFNDCESSGQLRLIRNDLSGNFNAMIQFAQSHVVDPKGNEMKNMPRLTSEKEALLLVTPTEDMSKVAQLTAEIYQDNRLLRTVNLNDPSQIALSDQSNADDRPQVQFSKRAWSAALKWNEVLSGLSIRIADPVNNKNGDLRSEDIDFAALGESVVQSIRLGLLIDPPKSTGHYMLLEPEKARTDYFQTIPAARMIVSKVEKLDTGVLNVYMSGKNGCTGEASTLWVHDAIGKIHSQQYPNLCLTNARTLSVCSNDVQSQVWEAAVNGDTQQLRQGKSCLDLSGGGTPSADGRGEIIMYGCGGGNNQKWSLMPQSHSLILAMSNSKNLPLVSKILAK